MMYTPSFVDAVSLLAAFGVMASFALPRRMWICVPASALSLVFVVYGLYLQQLPFWLLHLIVLGLQLLRFDLGGGTHRNEDGSGPGKRHTSFV